jgi:hypothetical protein
LNTRKPLNNARLSPRRTTAFLVSLLLVISVSCVSIRPESPAQPSPIADESLITPSLVEPSPMSTTPSPTATVEAPIPAGWMTHTNQRCGYAISFPADMRVTDEDAHSATLSVKLENPEEGARNFVYVSVIPQEFQGTSEELIYNYDPTEAEILLNMAVGESRSVRESLNLESGFSYQRLADTTIDGYPALAFENLEPWEFPGGTKETRYYLSLEGCLYQIGGYVDTAQSDLPGAITEDLLHQIVATLQVMP